MGFPSQYMALRFSRGLDDDKRHKKKENNERTNKHAKSPSREKVLYPAVEFFVVIISMDMPGAPSNEETARARGIEKQTNVCGVSPKKSACGPSFHPILLSSPSSARHPHAPCLLSASPASVVRCCPTRTHTQSKNQNEPPSPQKSPSGSVHCSPPTSYAITITFPPTSPFTQPAGQPHDSIVVAASSPSSCSASVATPPAAPPSCT